MKAGLFWNSSSPLSIPLLVGRFTGVDGMRVVGEDTVPGALLRELVADSPGSLPLKIRDGGIGDTCGWSGSISSLRRSAELSACSAAARRASSTSSCDGKLCSSFCGRQRGVNTWDAVWLIESWGNKVFAEDGERGGDIDDDGCRCFMVGLAKSPPSSESESCGKGFWMAMRRESSVSPARRSRDSRGIFALERCCECDRPAGACPLDLDRGDEGPLWRKFGGDMARGIVCGGDREEFVVLLVARGDIVRRRRANSTIGEDGGDGLVDAVRLYNDPLATPRDVAEVDREGELEKGLGDAGEMLRLNTEDEDVDILPVEERPIVCAGEEALLAAVAPDVAACRKVGGAVAMAFALARLAAIAAATEDFFAGVFASASIGTGRAPGFGLAFSSCFLPTASKLSIMINA